MFENFSLSNIWESDGLLISLVGYVIVFAALLILFVFISNLKNLLTVQKRKKLKEEGDQFSDEELSISGEVSAAIAAALHLHFAEIHDFENTVLTIKKVQKTYSPWSSKIYGLRQIPRS